MENTSDTQSAVDTSSTDNKQEAPVASEGSIANVKAFVDMINGEVEALCAKNKKWATDETTSILLFIFSSYLAQLPNVVDATDGKAAIRVDAIDVDDLQRYVRNFANMNATYNRYAAKGRIPVQPKGASRVAGRDLF